MTSLALHETTQQGVQNFIAHPTHALVLVGATGAGKETIARYIVSTILNISLDKLDSYPYFKTVASVDNKAIGVDGIRELQHFAALKIPRKGTYNRFIIITDAHLMTHEAQNALLKLIEEPPEATLIILTAPASQMLLPTITSRCQSITIHPLSEPAATSYFKEYDQARLQRAWLISGGLAGLMSTLLDEDKTHPLVQAAATARELLQGSTFERLQRVDILSKQSVDATRNILMVLQQMARIALERPSTPASSARWQAVLRSSYDTVAALDKGAQSKLALTNLMLNL